MTLNSASRCNASKYAEEVAAVNFAEIEARLVALATEIVALQTILNARRINVDAPLTGGGPLSADVTIAINQATATTDGFLTKGNWSTFNAKMTNPMSALGDMIVGGASGVPGRLAAGAAGTVLKGGATPSYGAVTEDDLSLSAVSTGNADASKHGFIGPLSDNASQFYNGKGQWATPAGVASGYTSLAFTNETSVVVTHNFGAYPAVQVVVGGIVVAPTSITHNSLNQLTVAFGAPTTGTVIATLGSPQAQAYKAVSDNYDILTTDRIVKVTVAGKTVTLITAVGYTGREFIIDNGSAGEITVAAQAGETINGEATQIIPADSALLVYSDGADWRIY